MKNSRAKLIGVAYTGLYDDEEIQRMRSIILTSEDLELLSEIRHRAKVE